MIGTSTKEKLMVAALDLFSQKGYSATSVDEIAESIGIKGPNLYKYFKGKEALIDEISTFTDVAYHQKMSMHNNKAASISSAEEFKEFTMGQLRFTMNDETVKKLRCMLTIEQFRTEFMKEQATIHQYRNILDQYSAMISNLMEKGVVKQDDPEILALEYTSPMSLLIQLCDREPGRMDQALAMIEKHIDHFTDTYFIKKTDK